MKKTLLLLACALFTSVALAADVETVTTTVTSNGTITEYTPATTFVVKEPTGPVTYYYGKKVVFVTKKGKVLTDDDVKTRIKIGIPVTIHYIKEGDKRTLSRVEIDDD